MRRNRIRGLLFERAAGQFLAAAHVADVPAHDFADAGVGHAHMVETGEDLSVTVEDAFRMLVALDTAAPLAAFDLPQPGPRRYIR